MANNVISRKIHFYHADVGRDELGDPIPFDPSGALQHINNNLQFDPTDADSRYFPLDSGNSLCLWIDKATLRHRFRLGLIRRSGLPDLDDGGTLTDLPILQEQGLAELIHIVVFDNNIVGVDFNSHGPRLNRLSEYFLAKSGSPTLDVKFKHLLDPDVINRLDAVREIRLFHLEYSPKYADILVKAAPSMRDTLVASRIAGIAKKVAVILKFEKGTGESGLLGFAKTLLKNKSLEGVSTLKLRGVMDDTGAVELIDVLHDRLVAEVDIKLRSETGRALDEKSAYSSIEAAYGKLEKKLQRAVRVAINDASDGDAS